MKDYLTLEDFVGVSTVTSITEKLVERFKLRRKEKKLSVAKLSEISRVSYGSIRRFERSGDISLHSLMKLSDALGLLEEFNNIFKWKIVTKLGE